MNLLLLEDDDGIAEFVEKGLREAGFAVERVGSAEDALPLCSEGGFDVAVVDIMLPGMDGLTFIETIRRHGVSMPILILSARQTVDDRVKGLRAGGDDYLTKPFAFTELLARIQALLRRSGGVVSATTLSADDLTVDLLTREVTRNGKPIELQPREFSLLEYLLRNKGQVLPKTMIMEHVWGYDFDPQTNVVDVLVSRLRSKIDRGFEKKLIQTVRGVGYALKG
jgi:two-component system, OmpR family, response regulator